MRFKTLLSIIAIFTIGSLSVNSQNYTARGTVIDAHSKEPVPFANVYLQSDPTTGVSADFDGIFELELPEIPATLEASAVGYETFTFIFNAEEKLEVKLTSSSVNLSEVIVKGSRKEDPAYALFKKVVAHKPENDHEKVLAYGCEVYNKIELDLIDISDKFKEMRINKPFRFVFDYIDSTSEEKPFLPLFLAETLSDYYFMTEPKGENEHIKASKIVGDFENESITRLLGITEQKFNIYKNWIPLVGKKFASPISDRGTGFYRYYLVDSNYIDNKWCYQIQFYPKHAGVNAFVGDFWVHDTTYAIKHIRLQILDETHLNFIEKLSMVQYFDHVGDTMWMPTKDFITISTSKMTEPFTGGLLKKLNENSPGAQAKRTTTYRDYDFNKNRVKEKVDEEIPIAQDASKKDLSFWETHRHEELNDSEKNAYFLVDTIINLPVIDKWEKILYTVFTGYLKTYPLEIGNFYSLYSNNQIEGHSFKVGLWTSERLSKKFWLGGYLSYGVKDNRWKHGLNFLYMLDVSPRQTFSINYINDIFPSPDLNQDFSFSEDGFLSSHLFRRNIPYKLMDIRNLEVSYYKEWPIGLGFNLGFINRYTDPYYNFAFTTGNQNDFEAYTFSEVYLESRFAFKEQFINGDFYRTSLGSPWPIFSLRYGKGIPSLLESDLDYHRLEFKFWEKFKFGLWGFGNFNLVSGKIWGRIPYLSMFIPKGNESFFMNSRGFNLTNEFTFATDEYVWLSYDHHFDGLILQVFPLFKKWGLRSVGNFRALYGNMSDVNLTANSLNLFENTTPENEVRILVPNKQPYMEASFGIENIFRLIRIDVVYKLNYHLDNAPNWGIRGNIHFRL